MSERDCYCGHYRHTHTGEGGACVAHSISGPGPCGCRRWAPAPKIVPKAERGRYRVVHVCMDMEKGGDDEVREMDDRLCTMERELRGCRVLGTDETQGWPSVRVAESQVRTRRRTP